MSSGLTRQPAGRMLEVSAAAGWREDRYGFVRWVTLPEPAWVPFWERIYVPDDRKQRLRSYLEFCLKRRADFSRVGLPVHGIALLHGPPGTGKSTLARGVANAVAQGMVDDGVASQVIFAEVDPHALPSQMLGESQRNTMNLLEKSLPELAAKGHPVIVALDEVNSLATRRSMVSAGRDPIDVMRATEAALRGLDNLAAAAPNVVILATSNYVMTIDEAMLDRVDLAIEIGLPDAEVISAILADTLSELPESQIPESDIPRLAALLKGRSGRDVRKAVLEALVSRAEPDEDTLTSEMIEKAAAERQVSLE